MIIKRNEQGRWVRQSHIEGGVKSLLGWTRLEEELVKSGELYSNERITHFEITEDGILYTVEKIR
jgi:hypothetical protein